MKSFLVTLLLAAPGLAWGQALLDFRNDYAFRPEAVEAVAERAYRTRLDTLAGTAALDTNPALLTRLRGLLMRVDSAARIGRSAENTIRWEFHTCARCGENASSMAGGRLLVGEEWVAGLALSDDELGFLLAHEVAHVLAEHTREFASAARYFVDNGQNRDFEDIQREIDQSIAVNLRMALVGAQQELEADYIGLILGAQAGLDPEAMPTLLAKLHTGSAALPSTHPAGSERVRRVQAALESARRIRAAGVPAP